MAYIDYDRKHWENLRAYMRETGRMFDRAIERIARLYDNIPTDIPFDINNYPGLKRAIDLELRNLANQIQQGITNGINNEWNLSNNKNNEVVEAILKGRRLPQRLEERWMGRNLAALTEFKKRTDAGLGLSDRVWNIVKGQAVDIERQLALGIHQGTPASEIATDMKRYLRNPDKLFRRVRDEAGNLKLSKAAKDFHPGRGVYRSSYKNALRLARTETNRAYQKADNERWAQQDFVLGVEVQRSNVPYDCDICSAGVGKYPKGYQWDLFHPNCRCRAIPILADDNKITNSIEAGFEDREYQFTGYVEDVPESFKEFKKNTNYEHFRH